MSPIAFEHRRDCVPASDRFVSHARAPWNAPSIFSHSPYRVSKLSWREKSCPGNRAQSSARQSPLRRDHTSATYRLRVRPALQKGRGRLRAVSCCPMEDRHRTPARPPSRSLAAFRRMKELRASASLMIQLSPARATHQPANTIPLRSRQLSAWLHVESFGLSSSLACRAKSPAKPWRYAKVWRHL